MQLFKRDTVETARKRVEELEDLHARASTGRDEASADLAYAIAAGGGAGYAVAHEDIRRRLARASAAVSDAEAGLGVARAALAAAEEREAAERAAAFRRAAGACNHATVKAAQQFDAALADLAKAYDALCDARAKEHDARRAAGLRPMRHLPGYGEICALYHASARLGGALRTRFLAAPLLPKSFRPMLEQVRNPDDEADAPATAQEQPAHVQ